MGGHVTCMHLQLHGLHDAWPCGMHALTATWHACMVAMRHACIDSHMACMHGGHAACMHGCTCAPCVRRHMYAKPQRTVGRACTPHAKVRGAGPHGHACACTVLSCVHATQKH
eukprot:349592-Chlamydomonas_euryale.AAC.2